MAQNTCDYDKTSRLAPGRAYWHVHVTPELGRRKEDQSPSVRASLMATAAAASHRQRTKAPLRSLPVSALILL